MIAAGGIGQAALTSTFPYTTRINALDPRMFRISLISGNPANPIMTRLQADSVFVYNDDLAFLRPGLDDVSNLNIGGTRLTNDRAQPSFQIFPQLAGNIPGPRPTQGHMSWIATLVPKVEIYSGQASDQYVLSIVVFNDRLPDLTVGDAMHERVVDVSFQGDGSTGGEVLLHTTSTVATEETLKLRTNDWILVSANQVFGAASVPRFQWYRVAHVDPEIASGVNTAPFTTAGFESYVTLMGQDWNMNYVNPRLPAGTLGGAEATLMEGVVAVYEKTIRLDYGSTY
jgi:hypothetical protein